MAGSPHNENRILVCGGGQQGIAMAAHLAMNGERVTLWNRTRRNIADIVNTRQVTSRGVVEGTAQLEKASDNMSDVIADLVMVVTPASAHRAIARVLAPYVHSGMTVVLNPGRTFGAIDFRRHLQSFGVREMPTIAEAQTIVYTCRRLSSSSVMVYAVKHGVKISALDVDPADAIKRLPICLRPLFCPSKSVYETSFSNVGMVLHCAPVLMNVGWIESDKVNFKYYYDGISPTIARLLEKLDEERLRVASAFGCKIESLVMWLSRVYGGKGSGIYECLQSVGAYREINAPLAVDCRYITEDVPCGLVPLESAGAAKGIPTPVATLLIDLANAVFDRDFRKGGRKYE